MKRTYIIHTIIPLSNIYYRSNNLIYSTCREHNILYFFIYLFYFILFYFILFHFFVVWLFLLTNKIENNKRKFVLRLSWMVTYWMG